MLTRSTGRRRLALLPLLVLAAFAFVAAACEAVDDDAAAEERERRAEARAERRAEREAERNRDTDEDGIVDRLDACPDEFDDARWTLEVDGCPDDIHDLVALGRDDVGAFWEAVFAAEGVAYEPPRDVVGYDESGESACGELVPNNAFYCPLDHSIYLHVPFLAEELETNGDFSPVFIIAHEWGHLVQGNLGILDDPTLYSIEIELQADCFAGVYARDADERGLLETGDLEEAVVALYRVGDPLDTPFFDPDAHGTPGQRIDAFEIGYLQGIEACLAWRLSPEQTGARR